MTVSIVYWSKQNLFMPHPWKTSWNVLPALLMFLSSLALAWNDYQYPGDVIYQINPSASISYLMLFLMIWFLMAHVFAVFPKRFLFTVALLFISRTSLGFPLNYFLTNNQACLVVSCSLVLLTGVYMIGSLFKFLGISNRPWFSWKHSISVFFVGVALSILYLPMGLGGMVLGFQNSIGDYVRFSPSKISLVERVFLKDGKKVFLIGMMHIGEDDFYHKTEQRIKNSHQGKRVVLTEGVADKDGLLPKDFASGKTYGEWAKRFGLKVQNSGRQELSKDELADPKREWVESGVKYINADIDVSELSPEHLGTLTTILETLGSASVIEFLLGPNIENHEMEDLFTDGLVKFRNDRLMENFDQVFSQDTNEIFVPWGAAHLPDIEERLINRGFTKINEEIHPVVRFWNKKK